MKAIEMDAFGSPEVLHAVDVPDPHATNRQVRVRLKAVGVNPYDAKVRAGMMPQGLKLPAILGVEIAGVVDEVAEGGGFKKGDEVFGWSDSGAYAELALATRVIPKPKGLSWEQAASLPWPATPPFACSSCCSSRPGRPCSSMEVPGSSVTWAFNSRCCGVPP
jgi:NADPH:quinone reductase-like Zn-dependent oxidoreductase